MDTYFSERTAFLTCHPGQLEKDGALPWKVYVNYITLHIPTRPKGLTPQQILHKLTKQVQKEGCEVCWPDGSEELEVIRALRGYTEDNVDISTFIHKKD